MSAVTDYRDEVLRLAENDVLDPFSHRAFSIFRPTTGCPD
jgi:hypothetical protein